MAPSAPGFSGTPDALIETVYGLGCLAGTVTVYWPGSFTCTENLPDASLWVVIGIPAGFFSTIMSMPGTGSLVAIAAELDNTKASPIMRANAVDGNIFFPTA